MDDADDVVLEANVPIRATMQKEKMVHKFGKGNDDTGVDDDNESDNVDLIEEVHELEDEDEEDQSEDADGKDQGEDEAYEDRN